MLFCLLYLYKTKRQEKLHSIHMNFTNELCCLVTQPHDFTRLSAAPHCNFEEFSLSKNARKCPSQVNKIAYYVIHLFIIYFYFLYMKSGKIGLTWGQWHQLHLFPLVIQFGHRVFGYCAAIAAPIRGDSRGLSVL